MYGFGYNESSDDYKVVGIYGGHNDTDTIVEIYSLKTGNWKRIGDIHNGYPWGRHVKYLNGALHWLVSQNSVSSNSLIILSLDLAKETYGEILQPVYDYDNDFRGMQLGVVGEWLCVLCDYDNIGADIWVMKVKYSWTKLVSIPYGDDLGWYQFSVPLCI